MQNNEYLKQGKREQLINAYSDLMENHIRDGRIPSFVNFMFNHIGLQHQERINVMELEVDRVHGILTRHTIRYLASPTWKHLRPIFIGCPDLPVWKHEKVCAHEAAVNDGLHYNVVALMPPEQKPLPASDILGSMRPQSRLTVSLRDHLSSKRRFYESDILYRIHVTPITRGTMADYALKNIKNGIIPYDSIRIWT